MNLGFIFEPLFQNFERRPPASALSRLREMLAQKKEDFIASNTEREGEIGSVKIRRGHGLFKQW